MRCSLFLSLLVPAALLLAHPSEAKQYRFTTTGMPLKAVVKVLGTDYPGSEYVEGGCPQYDTLFEAENVSAGDVAVTVGDGYVYHVSIDNDKCLVSVEFKRCFVPSLAAEVGVQYEYLMKTSRDYLTISPSDILLSSKKAHADRIIFIEDGDNTGRYYIFDLTVRCYVTYESAKEGSVVGASERNRSLHELPLPVNTWKFILRDDRKSVSIIPSTVISPSENTPAWNVSGEDGSMHLQCMDDPGSAWFIKPFSSGNLACATTLFSLPGQEYIHKIVPEEGCTVLDVDFGSLRTLKLFDDRKQVGNRYSYVRGVAPEEEGEYCYYVKVRDRDGDIEEIPVRLIVSTYLQSPTPCMGWLSWNWFESGISHSKVVNVVRGMEKRGLIDAGYNFVLLDDTWATRQRDQAKLTYDPKKFPKGIDGLIAACRKVNPKMRLGLYSDAGLMTCADYQPGSYGYEKQHIGLFDSWGVDMLKYDFCYSQASAFDSYAAMGDVINSLNERRKNEGTLPFVYYLCEWGKFYSYMWAAEVGGSMWRASGDSREDWIGNHVRAGLLGIVDETRHMWMWAGVNRFNDLDMTLIGLHGLGCPSNNTAEHLSNGGVIPGLTAEQARSNMALWCMLSSPLFHSCDFRICPKAEGNTAAGVLPSPLLTEEDIAIISNKWLIGIDQDPLGQQAEYFEHLSTGTVDYSNTGYDVYVKDLAGGGIAVSVTNRASVPQESVTLPLKELYLNGTVEYSLLDAWTGARSRVSGAICTGTIEPYQTKVYIISE